MMWRVFVLSFVGLLLAGCADNSVNTDAKFNPKPTAEAPTWAALEKLTSDEIWMNVGMASSAGDWAGLKNAVATEEFKAAVDAFATEEIPGRFATEDRKKAKDELTKALQELVRLAESKANDDEMKSAFESVDKLLRETKKPAGT